MRKRLYIVSSYPYAEEDSIHPPNWKEGILEVRLRVIEAIAKCIRGGYYFVQVLDDESAALLNVGLERLDLEYTQEASIDAWIQSNYPFYDLGKTIELLKRLREEGYIFRIKAVPWSDLGRDSSLKVADDKLVDWVKRYGCLENIVGVHPQQKLESLRSSNKLDWYYIDIQRDSGDERGIRISSTLPLKFAAYFKDIGISTQGGKKLNLQIKYMRSNDISL